MYKLIETILKRVSFNYPSYNDEEKRKAYIRYGFYVICLILLIIIFFIVLKQTILCIRLVGFITIIFKVIDFIKGKGFTPRTYLVSSLLYLEGRKLRRHYLFNDLPLALIFLFMPELAKLIAYIFSLFK